MEAPQASTDTNSTWIEFEVHAILFATGVKMSANRMPFLSGSNPMTPELKPRRCRLASIPFELHAIHNSTHLMTIAPKPAPS